MVRYQYANTERAGLVSIESVTDQTRRAFGRFRCLGCAGELIPVLGNREAHFRHKVDPEGACSRETYLHYAAKTKIHESYKRALEEGRPFFLRLPVKRVCRRWKEKFGTECKLRSRVEEIDLTRYFDLVELEGAVGDYRADVLLSSTRTDACLLVEIAVSHWCEDAKVASGLKILEATVSDEDDIAALTDRFDLATTGLWRSYNFREREVEEGRCRDRCEAKTAVFRVFESGKAHVQRCHPAAAQKLTAHHRVRYWRVVPEAADWLDGFLAGGGWEREAEAAALAGAPIRSCCLCRYAGSQTVQHPVFCKILEREVGHNYAADCDKYRAKVTI